MLHIIGMILKIIGLILAGILGILVLLILVVLFSPIRYEITASFPGKPADAAAKIKFSWLGHLVSGRFSYEKGGIGWRLRVLWKKYGETASDKKSVEGRKQTKKKKTIAEKSPEKIEIEDKSKTEDKRQKKEEGTGRTDESETLERKENDGYDAVPEIAVSDKTEDREKKRKSFFRKVKEKIDTFFGKIKYTFRQICDKIGVLKEKRESIAEYFEDETHRLAFVRMKRELVWIKRFLKPRKLQADIRFGFGDPYRTGQALAALSMIYPFVGEYMVIEPDFEEKLLEGELYVKGGMRLFHMGMLLIRLLIDSNVRTLLRDTRKFFGI